MSSSNFAKEIHHKVIRKFTRRKVIVTGIDKIWAMDLASMESFVEYNNGYKFILCIIDVFSKFAWCVPLKNKSATTVLNAVTDVVKKSDRIPEKIWVDRGSEFYNKDFQKWAKSNDITIYSTYGESKSVVVERFIRTLKEMITQFFTSTNSRDWVKILPKVMNTYNNRVHRTIGMSPLQASDPENEMSIILRTQKSPVAKITKPKFAVGDQVRISRIKEEFENGYMPNFSYEVFKIYKVLDTKPVTYKIVDYDGDVIEGSFYEQELLKTKTEDHYEVEKILGKRKVGKKTEYLVKFYGWPKSLINTFRKIK